MIKHRKVSKNSDGADASLVQPSDWNNDHISQWLVKSGDYVMSKGDWVANGSIDPYYQYASLILDGNLTYTDSISSNNIIDSSRHKNIISVSGDTVISTTQYASGNASIYFDGSGNDWIDITSSSTLKFGTGSYTVEMWVYPTSVAATGYRNLWMPKTPTASLQLCMKNATFVWYEATADRITSASVTANSWYHVAFVRNGTTCSLYLNGEVVGTTYTSSLDLQTTQGRIGCNTTNSEPFSGYLDDIKIYKGLAKYTSNFTPTVSASPTYYLPQYPSEGDTCRIKTGTRPLIKLDPNGSTIFGSTSQYFLTVPNQTLDIVYAGGTWIL